jgi:hypothetical protein
MAIEMAAGTIEIDGDALSAAQPMCAGSGETLAGQVTDVPGLSGTSEALSAFLDEWERVNGLVRRYASVIGKDSDSLLEAIDQFRGWDADTASKERV